MLALLVGAAPLVAMGVVVVAVAVNLSGPVTLDLVPEPSDFGMNLVLSSNGAVAYVTEPSQSRLLVVDARTGRVTARIQVGTTPTGLAISPSGRQVWVVDTGLLSLGSGTTVSVVSTATNKLVGTVSLDIGQSALADRAAGNDLVWGGAIDVVFSPDGKEAYVTVNGIITSGEVEVIDTSTLKVTGALGGPGTVGVWHPTSVAVSPDGREVWVSETSTIGSGTDEPADSILVFEATTRALRARIPVGQGPFFMALSQDGRYAYVADKESCDVKEIDADTLQVVATVRAVSADGCPFGIAAGASDGTAEFVTGRDHTVSQGAEGNAFEIVDFATRRIAVLRHIGVDPVTVAAPRRGDLAYVVEADRPAVYVLNASNGAEVTTWKLSGAT